MLPTESKGELFSLVSTARLLWMLKMASLNVMTVGRGSQLDAEKIEIEAAAWPKTRMLINRASTKEGKLGTTKSTVMCRPC